MVPSAREAALTNSSEEPPKVLIAEDDPGVRMVLGLALEDENLDVHFASDGEEAVHLAEEMRPSVMVVDQMMPKMDGHAVVSALRKNKRTRSIRVVVLSGMARGEDEDWQGADFIGKPFSPDELVGHIRTLLKTV